MRCMDEKVISSCLTGCRTKRNGCLFALHSTKQGDYGYGNILLFWCKVLMYIFILYTIIIARLRCNVNSIFEEYLEIISIKFMLI